eukprot:2848581-Prymnesium_polylepis.1
MSAQQRCVTSAASNLCPPLTHTQPVDTHPPTHTAHTHSTHTARIRPSNPPDNRCCNSCSTPTALRCGRAWKTTGGLYRSAWQGKV